MPKIYGGYYMKARCIKNSSIAHSPPHVREIWDYLLREANHADNKYNGFIVKRGQLFKSYKEIREDLCWYVGYRKMQYNENHMKMGMRHLVKSLMITTMKQPRGVLITILNYDYFQSPENYETTNETTNEQPMSNQGVPSINKNEKNDDNEEKKDLTPFFQNEEETFYLTKKKKKLSGKRLKTFEQFWDAFGHKLGKAEAADTWLDIPQLTNEIVDKIIESAKKEATLRKEVVKKGQTPKMAQGWLSGRRWEDELNSQQGDPYDTTDFDKKYENYGTTMSV